MRKFAALLALLSLLAIFNVSIHAQTRPRRVGQTGGGSVTVPERSTTAPASDIETDRGSRRPPTLGGAIETNDTASARTTDTSKTDSTEVDENEVVRVNTSLVTIPVSVLDRAGKYVPSIRQQEFRIWEEGVEQEIAYFATVEKPFTVALVIDTSGSTKYRLREIQDAAIAFVNELRPADRVLVVSFDDEVRVLCEATSDRARLRDAIYRVRPGDGTKLYDAVDFIINQRFNRIDGRKAMLLFTDGVDTSSRLASYESNARDAEELDALIYPVQYDTYAGGGNTQSNGGWGGGNRRRRGGITDILADIISGGDISIGNGGGNRRGGGGGGGNNCTGCSREEYERGNAYLNDLARLSGARLYRADTTRDIAGAFSLVAEELRRQYSLGYYPKQQGQPGQRRRIKVRVMRPDLAVQARDSYIYNPSGANNTGTTTAQDTGQQQRSQPVLRRSPLAAR
ncbi:MAG TPA: VWA domain-containing protein [Pyrinomonadaceae bacterium]|jgi:VWFA-related protein|nr:VWA domain-containing protein [Pyrinomonadaceae bacterium]